MKLRSLQDIPDLQGKKVFVRVDFNVPLDKNGLVIDDKRIRHALPTLEYLLKNGVAQIILGTHVGRPEAREPEFQTDPMAVKLSELLRQPVKKCNDLGESGLPEDQIILLENLRFYDGEKSKNETERDAFGKQLASLADLYVNEAFSNSHRADASMTSIPKFIPGYAGLGLQKEVDAMTAAISNPERPLVAVIGGLKADKLPAIHYLMKVADKVMVAGALACNLLKAKGYVVGASKVDDEGMTENNVMVQEILANEHVILPTDFVVADAFSDTANIKHVSADAIEEGWMALDIGPQSAQHFADEIKQAKTVLWFGPIGVFEMEPFAHGTQLVAYAIAEIDGASIVGGGDSASAVKKLGLEDKMTLVSTGGGASLEMIEGKALPALKVLFE